MGGRAGRGHLEGVNGAAAAEVGQRAAYSAAAARGPDGGGRGGQGAGRYPGGALGGLREEDILGLDVTVYPARGVQCHQRVRDLQRARRASVADCFRRRFTLGACGTAGSVLMFGIQEGGGMLWVHRGVGSCGWERARLVTAGKRSSCVDTRSRGCGGTREWRCGGWAQGGGAGGGHHLGNDRQDLRVAEVATTPVHDIPQRALRVEWH